MVCRALLADGRKYPTELVGTAGLGRAHVHRRLAGMKPVRLSSGLVRAVAEELKGLRRRPWKVEGKPKRAAVFVPLCRVRTPESQEAGLEDGEAAILLTVRSHNVSVSLPVAHELIEAHAQGSG